MRTFEVKVVVEIPDAELPTNPVVDDDFLTTIFNKAMGKIERRGMMAVDISEKIDGSNVSLF